MVSNFRDIQALAGVLRLVYEVPRDGGRAQLVEVLQTHFGFVSQQALLYVSTVLGHYGKDSADLVEKNGGRVVGSWARGEQRGSVGGWLSTMKDTWQFEDDLSYRHTVERYQGCMTTGPFFQSSYSAPTTQVERGIWAPSDTLSDRLELFLMPENEVASRLTFEWVERDLYDYRACLIRGQRFSRE